MIIEGTESIKGVLDLSSIKQQLKTGQSLNIKEDDFWQSDVQIALKMGWIRSKGANSACSDSSVTSGNSIRCQNTHTRSIGIRGRDTEIRPGQEFHLQPHEADSPAIRSAISKGMIKIVGTNADNNAEDSAETVSVLKKISPTHMSNNDIPGTNNSTNEATVHVDILDTNEEVSAPGIIQDKKGVSWNQSEGDVKRMETVSHVIEEENPAPVNANLGDPKKMSVVVDPNKDRFKSHIREQDVVFVDQEEEKQRVASHPKLQNDEINGETEVSVISDINDDEGRIANHPVLSKTAKSANDNGIDFLDEMDEIHERINKHPVLSKKESKDDG